MTWGSFLSRSLSLVIVLPLILTRLSTAEIALWYLFTLIINLQLLADIGFAPTFTRVIAYGMSGLTVKDIVQLNSGQTKSQSNVSQHDNKNPNWSTIERICSCMTFIYSMLGVLSGLGLLILGTFALIKPISEIDSKIYAWAAWAVIIVTSIIIFMGNSYSSYLQGTNHIAVLRRWEILISLGAIVTSFIVVYTGGGLLGLVISHQIWQLVNVIKNRWLCQTIFSGKHSKFKYYGWDSEVFKIVWPSAWRSGLGVFMTYGLVQLSGVVYAQFGGASSVASYLLGLRLIQLVSKFSQAPLYSKLPLLASLYAVMQFTKLTMIAQRGMRISYLVYASGFLILGIFATPILNAINSNAEFPNSLLWFLLGIAIFIERYGAMHIQLYSITNHIIWHIANSVAGILYLVTSLYLFRLIGVYAFPLGLLVGYLCFYSWFSAKHSYSTFGINFFKLESKTSLLPLLLVLGYGLFVIIEYV